MAWLERYALTLVFTTRVVLGVKLTSSELLWYIIAESTTLVAVLRLLLNLARAGVFIQAGRFALNRSWPLDLGMVAGGWLGLVSGNACAHFFRDANALHWWYAVCSQSYACGCICEWSINLHIVVLCSRNVLLNGGWSCQDGVIFVLRVAAHGGCGS